jgi:hypothetical protein
MKTMIKKTVFTIMACLLLFPKINAQEIDFNKLQGVSNQKFIEDLQKTEAMFEWLMKVNNFSFGIEGETPKEKIIPAYQFDPTKIDIIELNKQNNSVYYQNQLIKLDKLDGNDIELSYPKDLHPIEIEGLNKKNEVLDSYASETSAFAPEKEQAIYAQVQAYLSDLIKQATADTTMEQEAFQKKYLPLLESIFKSLGESDVEHKSIHYTGKINSVRLYFTKEQELENEESDVFLREEEDLSDSDETFVMQTNAHTVRWLLNTQRLNVDWGDGKYPHPNTTTSKVIHLHWICAAVLN